MAVVTVKESGDYTTLQVALDKAVDGDTINIQAADGDMMDCVLLSPPRKTVVSPCGCGDELCSGWSK